MYTSSYLTVRHNLSVKILSKARPLPSMLIWTLAASKSWQYCGLVKWLRLFTIADQWHRLSQRPLHSGEHKGQLQGLIEFPTDDVARVPIQDRHQVHPASL